jgi:hypothetical protein
LEVCVGPGQNLIHRQRRQILFVPHPSFFSEQLRERGAARKAPSTCDQEGVDHTPAFTGNALNSTTALFRPLSGVFVVRIGPCENLLYGQAWLTFLIPPAPMLRK